MNVSANKVNTDCETFWQENESYVLECDWWRRERWGHFTSGGQEGPLSPRASLEPRREGRDWAPDQCCGKGCVDRPGLGLFENQKGGQWGWNTVSKTGIYAWRLRGGWEPDAQRSVAAGGVLVRERRGGQNRRAAVEGREPDRSHCCLQEVSRAVPRSGRWVFSDCLLRFRLECTEDGSWCLRDGWGERQSPAGTVRRGSCCGEESGGWRGH